MRALATAAAVAFLGLSGAVLAVTARACGRASIACQRASWAACEWGSGYDPRSMDGCHDDDT